MYYCWIVSLMSELFEQGHFSLFKVRFLEIFRHQCHEYFSDEPIQIVILYNCKTLAINWLRTTDWYIICFWDSIISYMVVTVLIIDSNLLSLLINFIHWSVITWHFCIVFDCDYGNLRLIRNIFLLICLFFLWLMTKKFNSVLCNID